MVASKDREGQIIKPTLTGFAKITLSFGLCLILTLSGNIVTATARACYAIRPAELAYAIEVFGVIEEVIQLHSDAALPLNGHGS